MGAAAGPVAPNQRGGGAAEDPRRDPDRLEVARVVAMADREVDYLLIGGGLACANCARWLREEGSDGAVLLVGREQDPPYNRPECSKGYLRGEESRENTYIRPPS